MIHEFYLRMSKMQTCYCCNSVRQLSYAGCVYSVIYAMFQIVEFVMSSCHHSLVTMSVTNHSQNGSSYLKRQNNCYLSNVSSSENGVLILQGSIINPHGFSQTDFFYLRRTKLFLDISVLLFSVFLFLGLIKGYRQLLIPWIVSNICLVITDIIEIVVLLSLKTTKFEPNTAFVFTISFFLLILHIYAILGVIAQHQELIKGESYSLGEGNRTNRGTSLIVIETDYTPTLMNDIESTTHSKLVRNSSGNSLQNAPKKVKFITQKKVFHQELPITRTYGSARKMSRRRIGSPMRKTSTARQQRQKLKLAAKQQNGQSSLNNDSKNNSGSQQNEIVSMV